MSTVIEQTKPQTGMQKMIDSKVPLVWVMSTSAAILIAMGGLFAKVDTMTTQVTDLVKKSESRDDRMNLISSAIAETRGLTMTNIQSINRSEKDIEMMRRDIDDLRKTQRWLPK